MQIVALEDALADENYLLSQMASNHVLPFQLKSVSCTNASTADIEVLKASIAKIETDLASIQAEIKKLGDSNPGMAANLQKEYDWASTYLAELKSVTTQLNNCPSVVQANVTTPGIANVTNYSNISNLGVDNWVYGNISSAEYYIRMFKYITTHNVTTCAASTPFVLAGSTECSACNSPTGIYDAN